MSITARVNIASIHGSSLREKSDMLSELIWKEMKYRFMYVSVFFIIHLRLMYMSSYQSQYEHKRTPTTRFKYNCSQQCNRQHKPKKTSSTEHRRDKIQMDSFDCHGWLFITISEGANDVLVRLKHEEDHAPYWHIDIPDEVKKFVHDNVEMRPGQVRSLLSTYTT